MNFCTVTWDLDSLAALHTANRDIVVVITILKALIDMRRRRSRQEMLEVTLTYKRMATFGLSPKRTRQALQVMAETGIATVSRMPGQAARVKFDPTFYRTLKTRSRGGWKLA